MSDLTVDLNELVRELQNRIKATNKERKDLSYVFGRLFENEWLRYATPADVFLRIYGIYTKGVSRFIGRAEEPYVSSGVYRMFVSTNRGEEAPRKIAVIRNPLESPIEDSLAVHISQALLRRDTDKEITIEDRKLNEPTVGVEETILYVKKHHKHHHRLLDLIGEMVLLFEKFLFEHLDVTEDLFTPLIKLTDDGFMYVG